MKHAVALTHVPGTLDLLPVCGCGWRGARTGDLAAADAESDHHERTAVVEWETGPYPWAPRAPLTRNAVYILARLSPSEPLVLSQPEGVTASSLARRGLAVKDGRRGWRLTRRGALLLNREAHGVEA